MTCQKRGRTQGGNRPGGSGGWQPTGGGGGGAAAGGLAARRQWLAFQAIAGQQAALGPGDPQAAGASVREAIGRVLASWRPPLQLTVCTVAPCTPARRPSSSRAAPGCRDPLIVRSAACAASCRPASDQSIQGPISRRCAPTQRAAAAHLARKSGRFGGLRASGLQGVATSCSGDTGIVQIDRGSKEVDSACRRPPRRSAADAGTLPPLASAAA